jgi:serine/threonine-protein kinase
VAQTEGLGATEELDLERGVLESETISAAGSDDDLLGAMTRTLVPGTLALEPGARPDTQVEIQRSPTPGDRSGDVILGRYELVRQLGQGGMGTVYIAKHTTLPKTFAVKLLNPRYANRLDIAERFLQEARAVSLIEHENVVGVIDYGRDQDGAAFLVMEHLRGESLAAMCKREAPLPWPRVQHIMLQLCRALAAAHAVGVVHRDIKPDNVLRTERHDDPDFIKVLDFGLAKLQTGGGLRLTATGVVLGTPDYMSPEQARGLPSDHRTDIYAAGIMMYELLCGRVPFHATTFAAIRQMHLFDPPKPPSDHVPSLSEEIDAIVLRALAKEPAHRFASMTEMGEAIAAVGSGRPPVELPELQQTIPLLSERSRIPEPRTSSAPGRIASVPVSPVEPRRSPGRWVAAASLGLALIGLGVYAASTLGGEDQPDPQAETMPRAPEPESVLLRFETNVPVVLRDLDGGAPFGEQPTRELRLRKSDQSMRLVLAADGYRELHVVVTPDRDQILAATLEPAPAPAPSLDPTPASPEPTAPRPSKPKPAKATAPAPDPEPTPEPAPKPEQHSFAPEIRDPFGG